MSLDVLHILERIAENGTAPEEGCSRFGVLYPNEFAELKRVYLLGAFERGRSAEKFVVGPFGCGKTHFIRQLMEIAQEVGCVTAEVPLNKDIDFARSLDVYREVVREIRAPGQADRGIANLLDACLENVASRAPGEPDLARQLTERWVAGIEPSTLKEPKLARAIRAAFEARLGEEHDRFDALCRWLGGDVSDRALAKELGFTALTSSELGRFGHNALLSICQLVKRAQFQGTVVCFDEAEQGFSVGKRQLERIVSKLRSSMDAVQDLTAGAALFVYAMTRDVADQMAENYPAWQRRVADPGPGQGFFDGNPRAPRIELVRRTEAAEELVQMGLGLVSLLYDEMGSEVQLPRDEVAEGVAEIARQVAEEDAAVSNRATFARRVALALINVYERGSLDVGGGVGSVPLEEPEV